MKFVCSLLQEPLCFSSRYIHTLTIENQSAFRRIIEDIQKQIEGAVGDAVLSKNDVPIAFAKHAELLYEFFPFNLNQKPLLTKLQNRMVQTALHADMYMQTQLILSQTEAWLNTLALQQGYDFLYKNLSAEALIKAVGILLPQDHPDSLEALFDYMDLVRDFEREKLFITVNLRTFFPDEQISLFFQTVQTHEIPLLLLENRAHTHLPGEQQTVFDEDLCEI